MTAVGLKRGVQKTTYWPLARLLRSDIKVVLGAHELDACRSWLQLLVPRKLRNLDNKGTLFGIPFGYQNYTTCQRTVQYSEQVGVITSHVVGVET